MANYVALATVTAKLPSGYSDIVSDNRITNVLIPEASNEVDDLAGPSFTRSYNFDAQKFPQITDTPATPATIALCALWLTLSRVYEELSELENAEDEENETPNKVYYRRLAERKMEKVRKGEVDLTVQPTADVNVQDRYFESSTESDMDHKLKMNEMETLLGETS